MSVVDAPWQGDSIFASMKVFVSVNPRGTNGPEFIVAYGQPNFYSTFHFDRNVPIPLSSLISPANDRSTVTVIELALTKGREAKIFVNLRDKHGVNLSCHLSITAGGAAKAASEPGRAAVSGRFTTITISSASRIGNVPVINMLVSPDTVLHQRAELEAVIGRAIPLPTAALTTTDITVTEPVVTEEATVTLEPQNFQEACNIAVTEENDI